MRWLRGVISAVFLFLVAVTLAQESEMSNSAVATASPDPIRSLFADDTCSPPCWFGLTPGESTAEYAVAFFENHQEMLRKVEPYVGKVDPKTRLPTEGLYYFYSRAFWERPDLLPGAVDRMFIKQGMIDQISIIPGEYILLEETLDAFQTPDFIHLRKGELEGASLSLIYVEPRLRVTLTSERDNCNVLDVLSDFWVGELDYFSPDAAVEMVTSPARLNDVPQPLLLGYYVYDERNVPIEIWESWLSGEVKMDCFTAWNILPDTHNFPELTPEATEAKEK